MRMLVSSSTLVSSVACPPEFFSDLFDLLGEELSGDAFLLGEGFEDLGRLVECEVVDLLHDDEVSEGLHVDVAAFLESGFAADALGDGELSLGGELNDLLTHLAVMVGKESLPYKSDPICSCI